MRLTKQITKQPRHHRQWIMLQHDARIQHIETTQAGDTIDRIEMPKLDIADTFGA